VHTCTICSLHACTDRPYMLAIPHLRPRIKDLKHVMQRDVIGCDRMQNFRERLGSIRKHAAREIRIPSANKVFCSQIVTRDMWLVFKAGFPIVRLTDY
jgi:hypothetical protein